ncbi:hypothetical protein PFICI_09194 [Pestalotiopsis fici W106-1]|uniref:Methyltransferase domain-containing protein n=1 Tax=Pestalotiopsis fici (strain W106-1 / CGMCC3.15140) TaxID=1229662 RepID=W3X2G0_PESFW|nr:uncharacterized protein PFICI_09194 [Pestalotiopsis fici W106-1]ETS79341.1 hypothetical protein PFICI_09194 [Pestalotiopsis fici W106-1]
MPPSYGTQAYWDERFTKENHFEWLLPPDALTGPVRDALETCGETAAAAATAYYPRLLHIGCGSSDLSFHLRSLVTHGEQVVNVDYSEVAIRKCVEQEALRRSRDNNGGDHASMIWKTADLLAPASVAMLRPATDRLGHDAAKEAAPGFFDVIVDKSTSDCIACADDVKVDLPYRLCLPLHRTAVSLADYPEFEVPTVVPCSSYVHPLHVIAVHLAALARPRVARWLCLSYSDDRFDFLGTSHINNSSSRKDSPAFDDDDDNNNLVPDGFPDPRVLWRVEKKQEIVVGEEEESGDVARPYVHRPPTVYWLYTLVRTEQPL